MKGPFKVTLNDKPVTLPIEDDRRASLAYNILDSLSEEQATIDGQKIEGLSVVSADGESFVPDPDPEWTATMDTAWDAMIEKIITKAAENGETISEQEARTQMRSYAVLHEQIDPETDFMPVSYDKDKAMEMVNFLSYGMDPSVELCARGIDYETRDYYYVDITPDKLVLAGYSFGASHSVEPVNIEPEPGWAEGQMKPDLLLMDNEQDFTDAVAEISETTHALEK